jgi:pectin methylesterase-like acyl-CoA thioesterase
MKTLLAALLVTIGMNASADVFRPWGNVNTGEGDYVANGSAGQHSLNGFQPWTNAEQSAEEYTVDERIAAEFRKGIGFQPQARS